MWGLRAFAGGSGGESGVEGANDPAGEAWIIEVGSKSLQP
jgi:hypothetical protein